jgi:hypothetical protein
MGCEIAANAPGGIGEDADRRCGVLRGHITSHCEVWELRVWGDNSLVEEDIPEFQRRLLGIVDKSIRSGIRVEPLAYAELLRIRQQLSGHRRPGQQPPKRSAPASR